MKMPFARNGNPRTSKAASDRDRLRQGVVRHHPAVRRPDADRRCQGKGAVKAVPAVVDEVSAAAPAAAVACAGAGEPPDGAADDALRVA